VGGRGALSRRLLAGAATLLAGIASPISAEEVTVFAASSLTEALQEIAPGFEAATGHKVVFSFGASSDLARQIRAGAPADVFFSADLAQMQALEAAGLVRKADQVAVLSNVLVAVVPVSSPARIGAPADLLSVRRLALADPEAVPAGVYAREWLASIGLWEKLRERVVPTLNVRAALAAVESEGADAGIVYRTDALLSKRVRVAFETPRDAGPAIVYPLAPLAASKKAATAALVAHLVSPAARTVYSRHGFVVLAGK
jgi:molybdate transport system substrate-binding protein